MAAHHRPEQASIPGEILHERDGDLVAVAETGVDIISLGALAHSAEAPDIRLELNPD